MWRCFVKDDNLFEKSVSAQMPRCLGQMPRYLEISFKFSCELSGLLISLEVTSLLPKKLQSRTARGGFNDKNKNNKRGCTND